MEKVKLIVQGFIVGIGKIMPGVSGSVMAICFGLYERIIESLSSLKKFKENIRFMGLLFLGIGFAILIGSAVIKVLLINHYVVTMMFFIGMMIPGVFPLFKEVKNTDLTFKNTLLAVAVFAGLMLLNILNVSSQEVGTEPYFHEFISLVLCGLLDAASTIIPGVSGSALLMIIGYYETIITAFANILTFTDFLNSVLVLTPFLIGMGVGVVITSKLVTYLFKHKRVLTYMLIIVFATYSIITLLTNVFKVVENPIEIIPSLMFLVLGFIFTTVMEKLFQN